MKYQNKEIEIISRRTIFGKEIAEIRVLSTGEIISVPFSEIDTDHSAPVSANELVYKIIAAKIRNEIVTQNLLSPIESNIIPLPHQILALEKVMSGQFLRFLLADEVGMGKTIEAGLILKELKLRGIAKRTLILAGKTALLQWQQEMKKHFNETFHVYDTDYINTLMRTFSRLDADNEINIWQQHNQLIVSLDSLKPLDGRQGWSRQKIDEYNKYRIESVLAADFDLLIIDECHKVGGSTQWIGRYQMADILSSAVPNVLLLSATPHRGKSDHFRRIMQLLDPDAFSGEGMPAIPELEPYVIRTEKRQAIDYNGKPLFNKRNTVKAEVKYDEFKHSRQKELYGNVTEYVVNGFNLAQQTKNTSYGFVMLLFQRMMSSSTQAILDAMQRRAERLENERQDVTRENVIQDMDEFGFEGQLELDFEQRVNSLVMEAQANYASELSILHSLIREAKECLNHETDAKAEFLLEKLSELKRNYSDPDIKFLIFTEFTSTQLMLRKQLEERGGFVCEIINGSMKFDRRIESLKNFKGNAQVLISTDAAGESLNMQFAHIVINYDMPWNPMVLEQRIGRVDRIGQKQEVTAINLMLDNSIEKRVYEVVEIKLNQIMDELGIDKTADVLDSTIERERINKLYLTSLLDPEKFEHESNSWLEEIKNKLSDYKSTEKALPTVKTDEVKAEKTDLIKYSPLPVWLEMLAKNYLQAKGIKYQELLNGTKFVFPGCQEKIYSFNVKESLNDPIPESVSLQHDIIKTILSEAVPFTPSQLVPVVRMNTGKKVPGLWSIWHLEVKNRFETSHLFQAIFISDEGDCFSPFAQEIWSKIVQDGSLIECSGMLSADESKAVFEKMSEQAENILQKKFRDMENRIIGNTENIRANKEKAFAFQERQMNRIGIENIRESRLLKLKSERELWLGNYESSRQIIPNLTCLTIMKIADE